MYYSTVVVHAAQIESFRKAFSGERTREDTTREGEGRGKEGVGRTSLSRKEVEEMSYQEARGNRFLSSFTVWVVIKETVMTVCIRARVCMCVCVCFRERERELFYYIHCV